MKKYLLLLLLAACAIPETVPAGDADTCNAAAYEYLIGQDATALETVLLMGMVRVIRPDNMVTMDFAPQRINFMVAEDGTVQSITCG